MAIRLGCQYSYNSPSVSHFVKCRKICDGKSEYGVVQVHLKPLCCILTSQTPSGESKIEEWRNRREGGRDGAEASERERESSKHIYQLEW